MDVPHILRRLTEMGFTQEELATRLFVTQKAISFWINGKREPRGASMEALRAFAISQGVLDEEERDHVVPIMGYIGAGAEIDTAFEQIPPEGLDQVEVPLRFDFDVIGFRVKGASMEPVYHDGDVIVVRADPPRSVESLIGEEAAVRTDDGRRYVKHIMPGSRRHLYTLLSINDDPKEDVGIVWASEVVAMVRASQAKLVSRKGIGRAEYKVTVEPDDAMARKPRPRGRER